MIKNNKNTWKKVAKLPPIAYSKDNQQNSFKVSCQKIHNFKLDTYFQSQNNNQYTTQALATKKTNIKQNSTHSTKSTMLLEFPISKKNINNSINQVKTEALLKDHPNEVSTKNVLSQRSCTDKRLPNSSSLSINSLIKPQYGEQSDIFAKRTGSFMQRKDVRARMLKYMKDNDDRLCKKPNNSEHTSFSVYKNGYKDRIGLKMRDTSSIETIMKKIQLQDLDGWSVSDGGHQNRLSQDNIQAITTRSYFYK